MSRPSTLSPQWLTIAKAAGGITALQRELGMTNMTFFRKTRGQIRLTLAERALIQNVAKRYNLPSPLGHEYPATVTSAFKLEELELLGESLAADMPVTPKTKERLKRTFSVDQLVAVAESDAGPNVLRAASYLLDL